MLSSVDSRYWYVYVYLNEELVCNWLFLLPIMKAKLVFLPFSLNGLDNLSFLCTG